MAILPKRNPKTRCQASKKPAGDDDVQCPAPAVAGSIYCAAHRAERLQSLKAPSRRTE